MQTLSSSYGTSSGSGGGRSNRNLIMMDSLRALDCATPLWSSVRVPFEMRSIDQQLACYCARTDYSLE